MHNLNGLYNTDSGYTREEKQLRKNILHFISKNRDKVEKHKAFLEKLDKYEKDCRAFRDLWTEKSGIKYMDGFDDWQSEVMDGYVHSKKAVKIQAVKDRLEAKIAEFEKNKPQDDSGFWVALESYCKTTKINLPRLGIIL